MEFEEAEEIVSDQDGHTEEEITEAKVLLGIDPTIPEKTVLKAIRQAKLTDVLAALATKTSGAEHAAYNEVLIAIGEAKMRIKAISMRLKDDAEHIVHEIHEHFEEM